MSTGVAVVVAVVVAVAGSLFSVGPVLMPAVALPCLLVVGLLCSFSLCLVAVPSEWSPSDPCSGSLMWSKVLRVCCVPAPRVDVQKTLVFGWGVSLTTGAGTGAVSFEASLGRTSVPVGVVPWCAVVGDVLVTAPHTRLPRQTVLQRFVAWLSLTLLLLMMSFGTVVAA